jgi:hypothetical protein
MPFKSKPSITKRNREQARRERDQEKAERRKQRAIERSERANAPEGEDPDIAGIIPGPQRPPDET